MWVQVWITPFCALSVTVILCGESSDLPLCLVVVLMTAAISSTFPPVNGDDDPSKGTGFKRRRGRVIWPVKCGFFFEKRPPSTVAAIATAAFCSKKGIPSVLQNEHMQAVSMKSGGSSQAMERIKCWRKNSGQKRQNYVNGGRKSHSCWKLKETVRAIRRSKWRNQV